MSGFVVRTKLQSTMVLFRRSTADVTSAMQLHDHKLAISIACSLLVLLKQRFQVTDEALEVLLNLQSAAIQQDSTASHSTHCCDRWLASRRRVDQE